METYLVGGAVRDQLLGLPITERDWVVIGTTPDEMLKLGYQPVGKDFPVFLHPITHEEYALARTERKTGKGYKGFVFHTTPDVSLIEDLKRRDLTINAIALSERGDLVDPYGGKEDLQNKTLRHVSAAFIEDPVRILRVARFAARFVEFNVHPATMTLMQTMVQQGEVDALVAERVWQEFSRALKNEDPQKFLLVLQTCGAWAVLFPEIQLTSTLLTRIALAVKTTQDPIVRFAVLCSDLDKSQLQQVCARYRIPREFVEVAELVSKWWKTFLTLSEESDEKTIFSLLKSTDARRRPDRFAQFLLSSEICSHFKNTQAANFLKRCQHEIDSIDIQVLQSQGLKGKDFADALEKLQLQVIKNLKNLSRKK